MLEAEEEEVLLEWELVPEVPVDDSKVDSQS